MPMVARPIPATKEEHEAFVEFKDFAVAYGGRNSSAVVHTSDTAVTFDFDTPKEEQDFLQAFVSSRQKEQVLTVCKENQGAPGDALYELLNKNINSLVAQSPAVQFSGLPNTVPPYQFNAKVEEDFKQVMAAHVEAFNKNKSDDKKVKVTPSEKDGQIFIFPDKTSPAQFFHAFATNNSEANFQIVNLKTKQVEFEVKNGRLYNVEGNAIGADGRPDPTDTKPAQRNEEAVVEPPSVHKLG